MKPTTEDIVRWASKAIVSRVETSKTEVVETNEDGWRYTLRREGATTLRVVDCEPPPPVAKRIKLTGNMLVIPTEVLETEVDL